LSNSASRLRAEFARQRRLDHCDRIKAFVLGQSDVPYSDLARRMHTSQGARKVAISRLRKHYRDLLVPEISRTIPGPDSLDSRVRYLTAALSPE
jgi:hypothetical protein